MENRIPEEVRNILIPEFLMKELSDLEHCAEGCQHCRNTRGSNSKLSDVCLHLQLARAQAKISKTVPQVFAFLNTVHLNLCKGTMERRPASEILYEAFPALTVQQCNKICQAWAVYTAKYEDPIDKDSLAIRFRYYVEYQVKDRVVPAHVVEYWDRDVFEWKQQGIYFFSNTYRELDNGENLEERSRFLFYLLDHIRSGYSVEYIPGVFRDPRLEEDDD